MSRLQDFNQSNQFGNSAISDSKADIPSNSFKPRSRDNKHRLQRAPSNNQFKSFEEENNSQQMKIQRTRYNPNLHPQDRLSRSSEDFEFEKQSRTGFNNVPGAPLPPTQANFQELTPSEKAHYGNKYSNYYMEQKKKYNEFVRQLTQDVQIEQYPVEKLASIVTSKSKSHKSSSIEGFLSKNIGKRRNDSIEEVTKLKSHFLQSNVDQLSSVHDFADKDDKRGNKQEFDYSRDQSLAYNLGLKINKKGQFVNEVDGKYGGFSPDNNSKQPYQQSTFKNETRNLNEAAESKPMKYASPTQSNHSNENWIKSSNALNEMKSNFDILTPQKMPIRTQKNTEEANFDKNLKSPVSIQNLFGGNVKFNQGQVQNSGATGGFGAIDSPNSRPVSVFGITTTKKDGQKPQIKSAIEEEHESFIIKEKPIDKDNLETPQKSKNSGDFELNNPSLNSLRNNFQQNLQTKVTGIKKAYVANDAQKEMMKKFNQPHDSSRKVKKVLKVYSKKIESFDSKCEMLNSRGFKNSNKQDLKQGMDKTKSETQSKSNYSQFITPVPPSQVLGQQKVQIKPCNLNSSRPADHTKVRTLADRVESSFGDEDELLEQDVSPQVEAKKEENPKFTQKQMDDAKKQLMDAFKLKFTRVVKQENSVDQLTSNAVSPNLTDQDLDKSNLVAVTPTIDFSLDSLRMNHLHFQYPTRKRERLNIEETQTYLQSREIPCLKYNYTLDKYLNMDHFFATIRLSADAKQLIVYNIKPDGYKEVQQEMISKEDLDIETTADPNNTHEVTKQENKSLDISDYKVNFDSNISDAQKNTKAIRTLLSANDKQWDERMSMRRELSKCSFKVADIKSFTYGGVSSRFWILRKHINSLDVLYLKDLPFYCWECLTINTSDRELNLVIKDQEEMQALVEFLIINLQTKDGFRGTALPQLDAMLIRNYPNLDDSNLQLDHVFNEQKILAEQELYLKVFKAFNLMKIRMKISFMALQKSQTIKEFLLEGILESYNNLVQLGIIEKIPQRNHHDDSFFQKVLAGRANLKQFAWRIRNKEQNANQEIDQEEYNTIHNKFLEDEVRSLIKKCKSQMIFNTLQLGKQDEFELLQKHMDSQIEFGFQQTRIQIIKNRLELICRLGLVSGPQLIQVLLQKIKIVKQLFIIQLENGKEVAIPIALSQKVLPSSFRYYDPIIKIAQQRISPQKRKKLQMQQALIGKLSNQYSLLGMLGFNKKQRNTMIQKSEANQLPDVGIEINYRESLHTNQIQRSNYIKLDDNVLNFNFDPSGKDQMIGPEMQNTLYKEICRVQLKYINQNVIQQKRAFILEYKRQLSAQIENLKYKGMRIEKLDILDKKLDPSGVGQFADYQKLLERNEELRREEKEIKEQQRQKKDLKAVQRIQDKKLMTADQFEKRIDNEIEINLKYFSPEYKIQQEDYDDLMENIINNEKKMKEKRVLRAKGKHIRAQLNNNKFKQAFLKSEKMDLIKNSINLMKQKQLLSDVQTQADKVNDINTQIMTLFGQNLRTDMIHFERARILRNIQESRKKRRNMNPQKMKTLVRMKTSVEVDIKRRIQEQIQKNEARCRAGTCLTHSDAELSGSQSEISNHQTNLMSEKQIAHAVAVKSAFDAMNINGDGFATKQEFSMLLKQIKKDFNQSCVDEIFAKIDNDGSGFITFDEFLMACNKRLI